MDESSFSSFIAYLWQDITLPQPTQWTKWLHILCNFWSRIKYVSLCSRHDSQNSRLLPQSHSISNVYLGKTVPLNNHQWSKMSQKDPVFSIAKILLNHINAAVLHSIRRHIKAIKTPTAKQSSCQGYNLNISLTGPGRDVHLHQQILKIPISSPSKT